MLNTSVFSAFGVTPVTPASATGVTNPIAENDERFQCLAHSVTPVTRVTPENDKGWDEEDWQAAFDERAAILEYDAGMSRPAAEAMARREIDEQRRQAA